MDILDKLKKDIATGAKEEVLSALSREIPKLIKSAVNFVWTEGEAAEKLHISKQTLADWRKEGLISHTWIIPPSRWIDGVPQNGRPGYMDHHLLDFLLRHETRVGKQKLTIRDTLGAGGNVAQFQKKGAA